PGVGDRLPRLAKSPLLRLVRELDFSGNDLGNRGPTLLARSPHLERLDALDLSFTELGDRGLAAIAGAPVFGALRSLQINDDTRSGGPGIRAVAESPHLTALAELDVSGNGLSNVDLQPLFDGPPAHRLVRLVLPTNRLGDAGTAAFVASPGFARMAQRDRMIDLRRIEMGPPGAPAPAGSPALINSEAPLPEGNALRDARAP